MKRATETVPDASKTAVKVPMLLCEDDPYPVGVRNGEAISEFLIACEHAGNAVPASLKNLGLDKTELERHIAIDIGSLGVSELVSDILQAPPVYQRFSRLVAECSRVSDDDKMFAVVSDGNFVPGNKGLSEADRQQRIDEIVTPYQNEITRRLDDHKKTGREAIFVSMHSFTQSLRSRPTERPWHGGVCVGNDDRFTNHVVTALRADGDILVGFNEPYDVDMAREYTVPIHAERRGLPSVQFEIRQDLIADSSGQKAWAIRVAKSLQRARDTFLARFA
ncbi:N-formylglutamate amidohydrolase [Microvirga zambiensis]|uniref:N-formylglutamate amidohydrolase n=1 Tax=Microvirga zambiensis TaxID=1402137 RepID=UPI001FE8E72D|nr:N-formylglutamate amidohydrolase [Microvirga zambiensis]